MFHFKQFSVDQSGCAMKINTDGVLLGALTEANNPESILDIGTGTGVIALMLAQRFTGAHIDGVEIDAAAAQTAQYNFANSHYADRLALYSSSFEDFFKQHLNKYYNLIVSNPPFYINSLQSPSEGKKQAKHADVDFFNNLIAHSANRLKNKGLLWLILPLDTATLVKGIAEKNGLHIHQITKVKSYPESKPHREILAFGSHQTKLVESEFDIYHQPKQYAAAYQLALKDFFTIF